MPGLRIQNIDARGKLPQISLDLLLTWLLKILRINNPARKISQIEFQTRYGVMI